MTGPARRGRAPQADSTYLAIFEIDDLDMPLSELIAMARAELPALAAGDGGAIVGEVVWTVCGDRLVCNAPARRLEFAPLSTVDEVAVRRAARGDDQILTSMSDDERAEVARLLLAQGVGVKPVAERLHMSERIVRRLRSAEPRHDAAA